MQVREMIDTHPDAGGGTADELITCIEECYSCAQACTVCADACLAEEMVADLRQCIRLDLDCADICAATGAMASRRTDANAPVLAAVVGACAEACRVCAAECRRHAGHHEHCRICAGACDRCERACTEALAHFH